MNASTDKTYAERMGGALGRLWKKWLRVDDRICNRLVTFGLPKGLTKIVLWAVKLILLGVLFYAAFWVALILAIAAAAAGIAQNIDTNDDPYKREWREGPTGFGLYDKNEWRYDMGDPEEP